MNRRHLDFPGSPCESACDVPASQGGLFLLVLQIDGVPGRRESRLERFALWLWMAAFLASAGRVLMAVA